MENVINLTVNGEDWSGYVQRYGFYEIPEKVYGPNHSVNAALDGTTMVDYIRVKKHPSWMLMPMTAVEVANIAMALSFGQVSLTYFSPSDNAQRTIKAMADINQIALALKSATKEIYSDIRITFTEV